MDEEKRLGMRRSLENAGIPAPSIMIEADKWLKTVQEIRRTRSVCKKGLYRFETFEEADRWMEAMILSSIQESRL
jgi:transcriptional regulator NrdR family protein